MNKQRLIDATALSERLKDLDEWCRDCRKPGIEQARCIVHEMPTVNPFKWISVDDRLPENDYEKHWKDRNYYLVKLAPSGLMRVAKYGYKNHNWWIDSHDCVLVAEHYTEVTHWMPLPEAPKGSDTNE